MDIFQFLGFIFLTKGKKKKKEIYPRSFSNYFTHLFIPRSSSFDFVITLAHFQKFQNLFLKEISDHYRYRMKVNYYLLEISIMKYISLSELYVIHVHSGEQCLAN